MYKSSTSIYDIQTPLCEIDTMNPIIFCFSLYDSLLSFGTPISSLNILYICTNIVVVLAFVDDVLA